MVVREAIQKLLVWSPANHFKQTMKGASVVLARDGRCDVEMKIKDEHVHVSGDLHAGLLCLLIDVVSCCALLTHPKLTEKLNNPKALPATLSLHMSYHETARVGDVILVQANIVRTSGGLGFIETCIRDETTRNLLVKGQVTAYNDLLASE